MSSMHVYGADEPPSGVIVSGDGIVVRSVSIDSTEPQKQGSIHRTIQVGHILNSSHGGSSSIQIGTVGDDGACEFPSNAGVTLPQSRFAADGQTITVGDLNRHDLCVQGSKNKVIVLADNRIHEFLIQGDYNVVRLTAGVKMDMLRIHGKSNKIYLPKQTNIGAIVKDKGNEIVPY